MTLHRVSESDVSNRMYLAAGNAALSASKFAEAGMHEASAVYRFTALALTEAARAASGVDQALVEAAFVDELTVAEALLNEGVAA